MTASCTLCGELFNIPDDLRGAKKTLGELGKTFSGHLQAKHATEQQQAFDPEQLKCTIAQLIQPPMAPLFGMTFQAAILYSYLSSSDEGFNGMLQQMRNMLTKAMEQKPVQPLVSA